MNDAFRSKLFWTTTVVAAVIFFVAGINYSKMYVAETDILLVPKSDAASRNIQRLISTAQELPYSLAFYDELLQKNRDIEDLAPGLTDHKRKEAWNSQIKVEQKGGSDILNIRASDEDQLQAEIISRQTARNIAIAMSRHYNIKTELDIRLIEGPIVGPGTKSSVWNLFFLSLIFGLIAGVVAHLMFGREEAYFPARPSINFPTFTAPKKSEKKEARPSAAAKDVFVEQLMREELAASGPRKAAAPENLPVGSEFVLGAVRRAEKAEKKAEEIAPEPKTHEATEEEIKQRLNKLLGGKI